MNRKLRIGENKEDVVNRKYLNKRQLKAVEMLLNGELSKQDICEKLDISKMTLWRWEHDDVFQAELKKGTDELKAQAKRYIDSKAMQAAKKYWELAETADNRTKEAVLDNMLNRSIGRATTNISIEDNRDEDGFDLQAALAEIRAELKQD